MRESSTLEGPEEAAKSRQMERVALHCNKEKWAWGKRRGRVGSDTLSEKPGRQGAGGRYTGQDAKGKPQLQTQGQGGDKRAQHRGRGPQHPHSTVTPDQCQPPGPSEKHPSGWIHVTDTHRGPIQWAPSG